MPEIIRSRTIRPSTRLEKSKSYKIDTSNVIGSDTLIVNIAHESKPFKKSFKFSGSSVAGKNSISFRVNDYGTHIDISWSGAQPISNIQPTPIKIGIPKPVKEVETKPKLKTAAHKHGFAPIADSNSKVLILGTMPGEESLARQEYYANPRNLFWKIIASITRKDIPENYNEKKELLLQSNIAIWDICDVCIREGSLDAAIQEEEPNELETFLKEHPSIKAIAFNGNKAAQIFEKYFQKKSHLEYFELPSTSPANAGMDWQLKLKRWNYVRSILEYKNTEGKEDINSKEYRIIKTIEKEPDIEIPDDEEGLRDFFKKYLDCPLPIREGEKYHHLKFHLLKLWRRIAWKYDVNHEAKHIYDEDEDRDFELDEDMAYEMKPLAVNLAMWIDKARNEFLDICKSITEVVGNRKAYDKHYLNSKMSIDEIRRLAIETKESYLLPHITHEIISDILLQATQFFFQEIISEDKIRFCVRCNMDIGITDKGIITRLMLVEIDLKGKHKKNVHAYPCSEQEALMKVKTLYRKREDEIDFDPWDNENGDEELPIKLICDVTI